MCVCVSCVFREENLSGWNNIDLDLTKYLEKDIYYNLKIIKDIFVVKKTKTEGIGQVSPLIAR